MKPVKKYLTAALLLIPSFTLYHFTDELIALFITHRDGFIVHFISFVLSWILFVVVLKLISKHWKWKRNEHSEIMDAGMGFFLIMLMLTLVLILFMYGAQEEGDESSAWGVGHYFGIDSDNLGLEALAYFCNLLILLFSFKFIEDIPAQEDEVSKD